MAASSPDIALERGLPANLDAERFVLGAVLMDDALYIQVAGSLEAEDFSLEKHRRIFLRMGELYARGDRIDRVTVANELMKQNQLESVDGITYLVSLDEGLPTLANLESYVDIVRDKAILRRIIFTSRNLIDRCIIGEEEPDQILASAEESLLKLGDARAGDALVNPKQILDSFEGGINAFLDPSKRIKGLSTGFLKLDEMTGGLHEGELVILAARPSMGKTALALNIAQHVAMFPEKKQTVAVFSLEMSRESLLTRMICAGARVDQQKFRAGYLNQDERRRLRAHRVRPGAGAAVHRRHLRHASHGYPRQAAPPEERARAIAGGGGLSAIDERPRPVRKSQPGNQHHLARPEAAR